MPVDDHGRMRVELLDGALPDDGTPTIVCAQAGEVNTGAVDDLETAVAVAHEPRSLGARRRRLRALGRREPGARAPRPRAIAGADSWATDAHKWLNVPYDCGIAICAHPEMHAAAMEYAAPYLAVADSEVERDPMGYSPEFSRRARSLPVWAAIRSLGRTRHRRDDRAELRRTHARSPSGLGRAPRLRDPERRRPQPGAAPLRRRRADARRSSPPSSARARRG